MNDSMIISDFKLRLADKYPFDSKIYLYADYFEFVALLNHDKVGVGEMLDRLKDEGVFRTTREESSEIALANDKEESIVKSVFALIQQRYFNFGIHYPFLYKNGFLEINNILSDTQKLYLLLLMASNLYLFNESQRSLITTEFETISKFALQNYLPKIAIVKEFGNNSEFSGYATEKVPELAKLMNVEVDYSYLSTVSPKGTKDLGLDIVGWIPFNDKIGNYVSVFCQCACGRDWHKKLGETRRFNRFLKMYLSDITHAIFMPYSLANYENNTFYEHHVFGDYTLIFERYRILSLLEKCNLFNNLRTKDLVEKIIASYEDIV